MSSPVDLHFIIYKYLHVYNYLLKNLKIEKLLGLKKCDTVSYMYVTHHTPHGIVKQSTVEECYKLVCTSVDMCMICIIFIPYLKYVVACMH